MMEATQEMERAMVGSLLLDPRRIDEIDGRVSCFDFEDTELGALFDLIVTSHQAGVDVADPAAVLREARNRGLPRRVTEVGFFAQLYQEYRSSNVHYYAAQLKRASRKRELLQVSDELRTMAEDDSKDPSQIVRWLEAATAAAGSTMGDSRRERRYCDAADEFARQASDPHTAGHGVMTGILSVDQYVGSWHPGELVILAARPGMGKSAFAFQWAKWIADQQRSVLYVSLEMTDTELAGREVCGTAQINNRKIRCGLVGQDEARRLQQTAVSAQQAKANLFLWSPARASIQQIRAVAKRVQAAHGLDCLFVDYMSLIDAASKNEKTWEQVSRISRELKAIAKELGIPVIALCQVNREADGAEPRLSHLRYSGSIEQDADGVIFLHRDMDATQEWRYDQSVQVGADQERLWKNETRLIVAKHRHGEVMHTKLRWVPRLTKFEDIPTCIAWS